MDKSCHQQPSTESTRDQNSLNLSKLSHKISKTTSLKKSNLDSSFIQNHPTFNHSHNQLHSESPPPPPPHQHQPPVYNINKNDFRDVVQKLTGSPAHERFSNPPAIQPPKPQSSRLQRIRPPPLAHVHNHPLPPSAAVNFGFTGRPAAPLSPLPPFPTVHAAAESPVSAYLRYFHNQNSVSAVDSNAPPMGSSTFGPPPLPFPNPQFQMPSSPLAFGCLNSPRSAHVVFSPSLLFSSASTGQLGFPQLPLSPTVAASSPRWSGD